MLYTYTNMLYTDVRICYLHIRCKYTYFFLKMKAKMFTLIYFCFLFFTIHTIHRKDWNLTSRCCSPEYCGLQFCYLSLCWSLVRAYAIVISVIYFISSLFSIHLIFCPFRLYQCWLIIKWRRLCYRPLRVRFLEHLYKMRNPKNSETTSCGIRMD